MGHFCGPFLFKSELPVQNCNICTLSIIFFSKWPKFCFNSSLFEKGMSLLQMTLFSLECALKTI